MIQRRTIAISLIVLGALGLIAALWWFVIPLFRKNQPTQQPPPIVVNTPTNGAPSTITPTTPPLKPVDPNSPAEKERQAQERLKQQASEFVVLAETYANTDEFDSLREAGLRATKDLQDFLLKQRAALIAAHPRFGPSWGQTTRAIATRIISGIPILSSEKAEVVVQVQHETGSVDGERKTSYEEVTVSFQKSNSAWIAARIDTKTYTP